MDWHVLYGGEVLVSSSKGVRGWLCVCSVCVCVHAGLFTTCVYDAAFILVWPCTCVCQCVCTYQTAGLSPGSQLLCSDDVHLLRLLFCKKPTKRCSHCSPRSKFRNSFAPPLNINEIILTYFNRLRLNLAISGISCSFEGDQLFLNFFSNLIAFARKVFFSHVREQSAYGE